MGMHNTTIAFNNVIDIRPKGEMCEHDHQDGGVCMTRLVAGICPNRKQHANTNDAA